MTPQSKLPSPEETSERAREGKTIRIEGLDVVSHDVVALMPATLVPRRDGARGERARRDHGRAEE